MIYCHSSKLSVGQTPRLCSLPSKYDVSGPGRLDQGFEPIGTTGPLTVRSLHRIGVTVPVHVTTHGPQLSWSPTCSPSLYFLSDVIGNFDSMRPGHTP